MIRNNKLKMFFSVLLLICMSVMLASCTLITVETPSTDTSFEIKPNNTSSETKDETQKKTETYKITESQKPAPTTCEHSYEGESLMNRKCTKCGEKKNSIKILAIGNSFSVDATEHLWNVLHDAGVEEIIIGNLYYPGCSLNMHYQNSLTDSKAYTYEFYYKNTSGKWEETPKGTLDEALADEEWDAVTMQQASGYSGEEASYSNLGRLYSYVKNRVPKSCKFYWHMTWAYQQDTNHSDFPKYDSNQLTMYNAICSAVNSRVIPTGYFEAIIPSGTAVQNLRTSYFGDTLTRDGYHMSYNYGRYLTSLAWLAAFGGNVDDITWTPIAGMAVDLPAMKEAVKNAMAKPFEVTNSSYTQKPKFDLAEYLAMKGKTVEDYTELDLEETLHAYHFSTDKNQFSGLVTGADNSPLFIASKVFTKSELPAGTIIVIDDGYQYRPDAWVDINQVNPLARPENVSMSVDEVNDAWWGSFNYRGFNISKLGTPALTEADMGKLHIYVPN